MGTATTMSRGDSPSHRGDASGDDGRGVDEQVADQVEEVAEEHPQLENLLRIGWASKGVVYLLMGVLAISIARHQPSEEDASPDGALSIVMQGPGGRLLLTVVAVGLVLYSLWRLLTVALVRGTGVKEWLDRIGYSFSAAFYGVLAVVALLAVLRGDDPKRSSSVEDMSSSLLGSGFGRLVVGVAGLVVIAVAIYFFAKGVRREFLDDLRMADASEPERKLVTASGVVGWVGRALVTALVGIFLVIAAWQADPTEARGFDMSLRRVAAEDWGAWLVGAGAIGLMVYGAWCFLSLRHQQLD